MSRLVKEILKLFFCLSSYLKVNDKSINTNLFKGYVIYPFVCFSQKYGNSP